MLLNIQIYGAKLPFLRLMTRFTLLPKSGYHKLSEDIVFMAKGSISVCVPQSLHKFTQKRFLFLFFLDFCLLYFVS